MQAQTFTLALFHGRHDPAQNMDDWGLVGPTLQGIVMVTSTYQNVSVWFVSSEATEQARKQTGWLPGVDAALSLEMPYFEDMVQCQHTDDEQGVTCSVFYGDWRLQPQAH